ncbi:hypothetical protein CXG50_11160 [Pseudomonas plecoglossicida]|nr:hypothetical protein CSW00_01030 [Pseudomonas sp. MR 02]PLP88197.1 hypothetical protein CX682_22000 [Pseudomonas sp. FFUP_PS_41]PLU98760.1 hypothetical protein CXG52_10035 [Pseudomonas plecoglossicida]PLV09398.1 hypothetical protein CXG50_11160 [Pseudomonas plecoglossicida]
MSRKGCRAAPAICASALKSRGCFAALSRHKAAPTGTAQACGWGRYRQPTFSCPPATTPSTLAPTAAPTGWPPGAPPT